jgi:GT2 family glycosyltransferase
MDPMQSIVSAPQSLPSVPVSTRREAATLSVVVVNYRQWELTARLVAQLGSSASARSGSSEIVLVDNHSPRHRLLGKLRRLEGVSLRRWGRNRGFARAANEGVRLSQGAWVLLLNPDVSVPTGFLDSVQDLIARLDREEPRTGIVGLGVRDGSGRRQPSTGPFPTLLGTLARLVLPRRWRKYDLVAARSHQPIDWVSGCCLLVRRQVLDELGGLDPSFFLYYEDVDLCLRARQRGWHVRHETGVCAVHHHPLHGRAVSPFLRLLARHALLQYASLHWPGWQGRLLARIVRLEAWLRKRLARWRGEDETANWMRRLSRIAADMQGGRITQARRRLDRAVRRWEQRLEKPGPARTTDAFSPLGEGGSGEMKRIQPSHYTEHSFIFHEQPDRAACEQNKESP